MSLKESALRSRKSRLDDLGQYWRRHLEGVEEKDLQMLTVLIENSVLAFKSGFPTMDSQKVAWLVRESWLRCRFRKMVSVEAIEGPVGLVYFQDKETLRMASEATAAKTFKCHIDISADATDSDFEGYANALAKFLERHIVEHLPMCDAADIEDCVFDAPRGAKLSSLYDYLIVPEAMADRLRTYEATEGMDVYGMAAMLHPKDFYVVAVAGKYPTSHWSLPVFSPYMISGESLIRSMTPQLFLRAGWMTEESWAEKKSDPLLKEPAETDK